MHKKKIWIDLSFFSLITVAFLGMILRSKIVFSLPMIDYNRLLDAHGHFAFGGWVTLALLVLMVHELLPVSKFNRQVYQWLFGGTLLFSWGMLFSYYLSGNSNYSTILSTLFIITTYAFGYFFIGDLRKNNASSKTVKLLAVLSVIFLILSSAGPFMIAYLFASKSTNAILYRDALFTYLHLQYNGFFTLSVFALLVNKFEPKISQQTSRNLKWFSIWLGLSVLPSLFLSYLWHDPNAFFHFMAVLGSILLMLTFAWFLRCAISLAKNLKTVSPLVRVLGILSMSAFMLKISLQSLTILPKMGDAVFGDRPIIIGFLHLVFLGLVSLFLLAYFVQSGSLNMKFKLTGIAVLVFLVGVVLNEVLLMTQGLGVMLIKSSHLFPWLLWGTSICLFVGSVLLGFARIKTNAGYSGNEKITDQ